MLGAVDRGDLPPVGDDQLDDAFARCRLAGTRLAARRPVAGHVVAGPSARIEVHLLGDT